MSDGQAHFNLVDEPWIKAITLDGETIALSLRELFHEAHNLRALANDTATQDFAILRVLLAILQRSVIGLLEEYDYPSEAWGALWDAKCMPFNEIDAYLNEWHHRFDLFDSEEPFMQVAGMQAANGSTLEIKKIVADIPDGRPLFSQRSVEELDSISYAEAARWLIHLHAFDTAGIKTGVIGDSQVKSGKSYPIGTGWAGGLGGVYLEGGSLFETLVLNLCLCDDCRDSCNEYDSLWDDQPTWEQAQKTPGDDHRYPSGYADIYSWQSRRVRLIESRGRVARVILTNGDKLEAYNKCRYEPMTPWRRSLPQEKKLKIKPVHMPLQHQSGKAMWRGLTSLLPTIIKQVDDQFIAPGVVLWATFLTSINAGRKLRHDGKIRIHASGLVYGVQNSVISELVDDSLYIDSSLLSEKGADAVEEAKSCMEATEKAVRALGRLAERIELASGIDPQLSSGPMEAAEAEAYYELDGAFRTWLSQLTPDSLREQREEWYADARRIIWALGRKALDNACPAALRGRSVKKNNREVWMSAGKAEALFKSDLAKALPENVDEHKEGEVE